MLPTPESRYVDVSTCMHALHLFISNTPSFPVSAKHVNSHISVSNAYFCTAHRHVDSKTRQAELPTVYTDMERAVYKRNLYFPLKVQWRICLFRTCQNK